MKNQSTFNVSLILESPEEENASESPQPRRSSSTSTTTRRTTTTAATTTRRPTRTQTPHYYTTTLKPPAATRTPSVVTSHRFPISDSADIRFNPAEINISLNPDSPPRINKQVRVGGTPFIRGLDRFDFPGVRTNFLSPTIVPRQRCRV